MVKFQEKKASSEFQTKKTTSSPGDGWDSLPWDSIGWDTESNKTLLSLWSVKKTAIPFQEKK